MTPDPVAPHHQSGESFDLALAIITAAAGPDGIDREAIELMSRPLALDPARCMAALQMTAIIAAGFVELMADSYGCSASEVLAYFSELDRNRR